MPDEDDTTRARYNRAAGFTPREFTQREPYPDIEVQTQRAYVLADLTGASGVC